MGSGREDRTGDNWARALGNALDESDVLVALLTPGALEQTERMRRGVQDALPSRSFEHRLVPVLVGPTFAAGKDVPWILLKMDPVTVASPADGFGEVIERVRTIAAQQPHAAG